ncbi:flagellar basal-body rod protein FlgC [Natranaerovirga pectinivora]|uniref:Flagellar basal-body rod protein FlgC n=1 Tax=Natranaerovirga pectinivora TaxID=682400 RepID=A0A4V2V0J9_9FIRM|nr:flagellar basal body rod protein FlgC [Natranaerovirga pectinivora]TCT16417.1 flagellar basal-body rod protein FlgC [Natranaerovirga pectinivora]
MSFFSSLNSSASGLTAQRLRMDIISQNIANVNTTRTENGQPYKRKTVIFEEKNNNKFNDVLNNTMNQYNANGVRVSRIVEDERPFMQVYDPTHPDANEEGYVLMPNVNVVEEMTNMISANRAYEANVTALNASKGMAMKALEIGR